MQIAIGLYPGFTALDAIGPYQVLTQVPGVEVVLCAAETGRLSDDNGLLHLDIEHTFAEVDRPDLLLVPGGFITRKLARDRDPIVGWIASAHEHTTYTTSVCTGALLLGAAGVLDGLEATTHWFAYDELATYGATPTERRVVQQGKVWTAAGVSAGIDLALTLVAEVWGPEVSQAIQLGIEYDPQPPYDSGAPSKADPAILELVRAISAEKEAAVRAG
ncbi:MAG: transcriptional regulator containing an amidase domain and an AraC-type DNA-binding domain [Ilumatobacteraceae bacterium]|nr:transcriptional regulator containing an amidase domain and an AraC-type DNA-binding domain [Ilumatobacteraceae bacterium]